MYSERKKHPERDDSLNCLVGWSRTTNGNGWLLETKGAELVNNLASTVQSGVAL